MDQSPAAGSASPAPSDERSTASIHHYAVRLPPFWTHNPVVWFLQVESQFALAGITTQLTQFRHVVSVLPQEVAAQLVDILAAPPATNPYDALKSAVLERTTASERKRFQELLSAEDLGDRRPTELLRHMNSLLGERAASFDQSLLKQLFLQRLPATAQMILASASTLQLQQLAELADKIIEVSPQSISAMPSAPPLAPAPLTAAVRQGNPVQAPPSSENAFCMLVHVCKCIIIAKKYVI